VVGEPGSFRVHGRRGGDDHMPLHGPVGRVTDARHHLSRTGRGGTRS
jgi:hypothetical protein